MTKTIFVAVSLLALSFQAQAADSPCKGLDNASCSALAGCAWQAERVAGEKSDKTGKPYTRSMKAHCRKGGPLKVKKADQAAS